MEEQQVHALLSPKMQNRRKLTQNKDWIPYSYIPWKDNANSYTGVILKKEIADTTNTSMSSCVSKCRSQEPDVVGKKRKMPQQQNKNKTQPYLHAHTLEWHFNKATRLLLLPAE